eukprot:8492356-Lingulodinium_polyedra.AAC.1
MSQLAQRCSGSESRASGRGALRGPRPSQTEQRPGRQRPGRPASRSRSFGSQVARQDPPCAPATTLVSPGIVPGQAD